MSRRVRKPQGIEAVAANWILRRDAGLTLAEAAEFERWQGEDQRNFDAVTRKSRAWTTLDRPYQSGQADLLLARLASRAVKRRRRWIGAGAAGIAMLIIASTSQLRQVLAPAAIEHPGMVFRPESRVLPDGSTVELKFGAEVAVDFDGAFRRVILKTGEAYFQVARNPDRRFVVTAGNVEFRALGTAFSVGLGSERVDLLVTEGQVAVDAPVNPPAPIAAKRRLNGGRPAYDSPAQTLATVDAGKRLALEFAPPPLAPAPVPVAVTEAELLERMAWRAPRLEFSETPLGEAVRMMNRFNDVRFLVEDPTLARLPISGLFRADNFETFVRLLEGTCGIKAERSGDVILLQKAGG